MAYRGANSAPIGLHYSGARGVFPAFVATGSSNVANNLSVSFDGGLTWARATVPAPGSSWQGAAYSPSLGYGIATSANGGANGVVRSFDGLTWTALAGNNLTVGNWRQCVRNADDSLFVVVGIGGVAGQRAATSPDGITWTLRATPNLGGITSSAWLKVSVDPVTGFLYAACTAAGQNPPAIVSMDGGVTWAHTGLFPAATDVDAGFAYWPAQSVIRGEGSGNGNLPGFFSLDNGATWTQVAGNPPILQQCQGFAINPNNGLMLRCQGAVGGGFFTIGSNVTIPPGAWTNVLAAGAAGGPALWSDEWEIWLVGTGTGTFFRSDSATAAAGSWATIATATITGTVTDLVPMPFA